MGYTLDDKLVIGIASSALFDLGESDRVYREQGIEAYRAHQRAHESEILGEGVAFPFVRRLLALNPSSQERLVEVVLLSRNDPDTGLRVFNSIEAYGLDISRGGFLGGREPFRFMESFRCALFLSNHEPDVRDAIARGYPAGLVVDTSRGDDRDDDELRIAFDFDGVIVDDEAETIFQKDGVESFHAHESARADFAHNPGPCKELLERIDAQLAEESFRHVLAHVAAAAENLYSTVGDPAGVQAARLDRHLARRAGAQAGDHDAARVGDPRR